MTTKKRVTIREASLELRKLGFQLDWKSTAGNCDRNAVDYQFKRTALSGEIFVRLESRKQIPHHVSSWNRTVFGHAGSTPPIEFLTIGEMRRIIVDVLCTLHLDVNNADLSNGATALVKKINSLWEA